MNGAQLHLALNHLPVVGFILILPLVIIVSIFRKQEYRKLALVGTLLVGLLALPAFLTGEPAEDVIEDYPGITEAKIESHEESAEIALIAALVTASLAAVGLLPQRRLARLDKFILPLVTVSVLTTTVLMVWVGHEGGKIRHPEIEASGQVSTSSSAHQNSEIKYNDE